MPPAASFAGLLVGSALFGTGLVVEAAWLILLGFLVMTGAIVLGLVSGRPAYS